MLKPIFKLEIPVVSASLFCKSVKYSFPDLEILPQEAFDLDTNNKYSKSVVGFPKGNDNEALIKLANKVIKENLDNGNLAKWKEEYKKMSVDAVE